MEFKEIDIEGELTLKAMSHGSKLNKWMYSQIKPFANGKILEIGSGIGNISEYFIEDKKDIQLSDIRNSYVSQLKKKFPDNTVLKLDLVHEDFDKEYKHLIGTFDLAYALNVIEHIENDKLAIININKLLRPGGFIYILVPAYQSLYNNFDRALLHYRRYTRKSLLKIFPLDLKFVKCWNFNFAGIFGWYIVGNIFKRNIIPESNMKLYNFLTPLFRLMDVLILRKIGLSVVAVYKKL